MNRTKLNFVLAIIAWALAVACLLAYQFSWKPRHMEAPEPEPIPDDVVTVIHIPIEEENKEAIAFYPVPIDHDLQAFIIHTCEEYHIDPAIIVAMIDRESSFKADAIGDSGESVGLMQVKERWHSDRMERLGVFDLFNPYQNVTVGIDYLAELHDRYDGNIEMALMAFNAGPSGAHKHYFSKGIFSSDYSKYVLEMSEALKEGLEDVYFCV